MERETHVFTQIHAIIKHIGVNSHHHFCFSSAFEEVIMYHFSLSHHSVSHYL